jgi:hypothetical protein
MTRRRMKSLEPEVLVQQATAAADTLVQALRHHNERYSSGPPPVREPAQLRPYFTGLFATLLAQEYTIEAPKREETAGGATAVK